MKIKKKLTTRSGGAGFKKKTAVIAFLFMFVLGLWPLSAFANAPKSVELSYNKEKQELSVKIVHPASFGFHYIKQVVIKKNGAEIGVNDYKSQPDKTEWTYTYAVAAEPGDELEAIATCSVTGSKTEKLKLE